MMVTKSSWVTAPGLVVDGLFAPLHAAMLTWRLSTKNLLAPSSC